MGGATAIAVAAWASAVLTAGCAATKGPPPWIELHSPNFVLVTDLSEQHAAKLSQDLELFRSVVQVMTNPTHLEPRVPTRIYVL